MTQMEQADNLLEECAAMIGARLSPPESDNGWVLVHGEDMITVHLDADENRLVFTANAGKPSTSARDKAYELMLRFNGLRNRNGKTRIALAAKDGEALLSCDALCDHTNADQLASRVKALIEKTGAWRDAFQQGKITDDETSGADKSDASIDPYDQVLLKI